MPANGRRDLIRRLKFNTVVRIVHVWILNTATKTEVQHQKSSLRRNKDQVQSGKHTYSTEF